MFKFRIVTLGLYRAVVRLNLVHLGDTVTQEEIETTEFEVRISLAWFYVFGNSQNEGTCLTDSAEV